MNEKCCECGRESEHQIIGRKGNPIFICSKCWINRIRTKKKIWRRKYKKVWRELRNMNYFNVIIKFDKNDIPTRTTTKLRKDINSPVDIIRKEMENLGYYEDWIDVHDEEFLGLDLEVVNYLSFTNKKDKSDNITYHFEIYRNENGAIG